MLQTAATSVSSSSVASSASRSLPRAHRAVTRGRRADRVRAYALPRRSERSAVRIAPADLRDPWKLEALLQRRMLVHSAYAAEPAWKHSENRQTVRGDGLDDVRTELGPLLRRLLEPQSVPAGSNR